MKKNKSWSLKDKNMENIKLHENHYRNFDRNFYRFDFQKYKNSFKRLNEISFNNTLKMNKCNFYSEMKLRKIKI